MSIRRRVLPFVSKSRNQKNCKLKLDISFSMIPTMNLFKRKLHYYNVLIVIEEPVLEGHFLYKQF